MPTSSSQPARDSPARRQRRRRTHQRTDSNGELLAREGGRDRYESERDDQDRIPPRRQRRTEDDDERRRERRRERPPNSSRTRRAPESEYTTSGSGSRSAALSMDQLAKLDKLNKKLGYNDYDALPRPRNRDRDYVEVEVEEDDTRNSDLEREREDRRREKERRREERRRKRREEERKAWLAGDDEQSDAPIRGTNVRSSSNHDRTRRTHDRRDEDYDYIREKRVRPRKERKERRVASGQVLERGDPGEHDGDAYYSEKDEYTESIRRRDGSDDSSNPYIDPEEEESKRKRRKKIFIGVGVVILLLAIIIPVAVVLSKKSNSGGGGSGGAADAASGGSGKPSNSNLNGVSQDSVPAQYKGTWLDPFSWYDTTDFNVTFTDVMVGGLPIMGLMSDWNDTARANDQVPPLNEAFEYGKMPIRGCNLGGWLSIEPFITPSLFASYKTSDGVVDEWTLTQTLGPTNAKSTLEKHYSSWVTEQTFQDLQAAGFDHIRIPFSYWAVTTYEGDPYVAQVSWRYLLRGIEWARKYGLRINLDLHGAPGSQNGWNHSGRQGQIRWLNGTDGTTNGDRTIDVHKQLSAFFTQPRYKNIVTMYGLVNEPRMVELDQATVLAWTEKAITAVRANNFTGIVVFGDGFMGLDNWQGRLTGQKNLLLDVHQYVIFNVDQIVLNHHDKLNFACAAWTQQALRSQNTATGFGPTLCGEWSQADTDCAQYLNNVGVGSRWEGTLNMVGTPGGSLNGSVLTPTCPTQNNPRCSCDGANANPSDWSQAYKQWLLMFAEAQMHSFEQGWGWFYWTWQTESAAQWSYKAGLAAGTMPKVAYQRSFDCSQDIPSFDGLPEYY